MPASTHNSTLCSHMKVRDDGVTLVLKLLPQRVLAENCLIPVGSSRFDSSRFTPLHWFLCWTKQKKLRTGLSLAYTGLRIKVIVTFYSNLRVCWAHLLRTSSHSRKRSIISPVPSSIRYESVITRVESNVRLIILVIVLIDATQTKTIDQRRSQSESMLGEMICLTPSNQLSHELQLQSKGCCPRSCVAPLLSCDSIAALPAVSLMTDWWHPLWREHTGSSWLDLN